MITLDYLPIIGKKKKKTQLQIYNDSLHDPRSTIFCDTQLPNITDSIVLLIEIMGL